MLLDHRVEASVTEEWNVGGVLVKEIPSFEVASDIAFLQIALLVLVVTTLAVYAVAEYSVPVVPAFVLLGAVGLFGARRRTTEIPGRASSV